LLSLLRIFEYFYFICFHLLLTLHTYILPEKTMQHFVILRFQKVNMCRDGLSLLLLSVSFFFFLYVILNTCMYVCVVLIRLVRLLDRQKERGRERERLCGYKKISNTKKTKKDILFLCRSLLHIHYR
jgi:hypothetical protein